MAWSLCFVGAFTCVNGLCVCVDELLRGASDSSLGGDGSLFDDALGGWVDEDVDHFHRRAGVDVDADLVGEPGGAVEDSAADGDLHVGHGRDLADSVDEASDAGEV